MIKTIIHSSCLFFCIGYIFYTYKGQKIKIIIKYKDFCLDLLFIFLMPELCVLAIIFDKFWLSKIKKES
jgi:hypothetical protein